MVRKPNDPVAARFGAHNLLAGLAFRYLTGISRRGGIPQSQLNRADSLWLTLIELLVVVAIIEMPPSFL
jgi:hypothetical protein